MKTHVALQVFANRGGALQLSTILVRACDVLSAVPADQAPTLKPPVDALSHICILDVEDGTVSYWWSTHSIATLLQTLNH